MKCLKASQRKNELKLVFTGALEARYLSTAQAEILKRIKKSPSKVVVELGQYEKIDFSFIQLLLALQKSFKTLGLETDFKLDFSEEDADLLSKLNIINLLHTKS